MKLDVFREVLSKFPSGVTVVTTRMKGRPHGLTVSAFCSVSLDPRQILISIRTNAYGQQLIRQSKIFAVNILAENQKDVAWRFADPKTGVEQRFGNLRCLDYVTGAPIVDDVAGWLDCILASWHETGDHTILIGNVVACGLTDAEPLVFAKHGFTNLAGAEQHVFSGT
jgi:flavin reductase (DIM6/NTAB) family NADH-FMN oxidoreductase RutF